MTTAGDLTPHGEVGQAPSAGETGPIRRATETAFFETACSIVFELVATLFRETGIVHPQLIGLRLRAGRAVDSHIEWLKVPDRTPVLIERMRRRWDLVAHVRPASAAPAEAIPTDHPARHRFAAIELHAACGVARAYCCVDSNTRDIRAGSVAMLTKGNARDAIERTSGNA